MASCCLRASTLFAYDVKPALGRKGFLLLCQFFPAGPRRCMLARREKGKENLTKKSGGGLGAYRSCVLILPQWWRVLRLRTTS